MAQHLPAVIFGAGNKGQELFRELSRQGRHVVAFIDSNARPAQFVDGLPVVTPAEWLESNEPTHCEVIMAIHNHTVDMVQLLAAVQKMGFAKVTNLVEFYRQHPGALPDHYWLTSPQYYEPFEGAIDDVRGLLADDVSRELLDAIVAFRLTGDFSRLPPPSIGDQYAPKDLPRWSERLRFIDCGAFNGDTLAHMSRHGYSFEAIAAFEPDEENFAELAAFLRTRAIPCQNIFCFPCGVAGSNTLIQFSGGQGSASAISNSGGCTIQCLSLDDTLLGFRPNLVKMDIEGAELGALRGARIMISGHLPGLAISLYHHPAHLWQIPLMLAEWRLNYTYHIRMHYYNTFDLVLYAFPNVAS